MTLIRVLIVDDHEIVREGLQTLLMEEQDVEVAGLAADGYQALELAQTLQADVVLMDLVMPDIDGIEATRRLRLACPNCQVLVLTSFADDQRVAGALQAGAVGYLLKDVLKADLLRAIRDAAQGKPTLHPEAQKHLIRKFTTPADPPPHNSLTTREMDILRLIATGHSNKEIAAALHLTEGTVKGYVSTVLSKLGVEDRTQAALYAVKKGLA